MLLGDWSCSVLGAVFHGPWKDGYFRVLMLLARWDGGDSRIFGWPDGEKEPRKVPRRKLTRQKCCGPFCSVEPRVLCEKVAPMGEKGVAGLPYIFQNI